MLSYQDKFHTTVFPPVGPVVEGNNRLSPAHTYIAQTVSGNTKADKTFKYGLRPRFA
jgi:hypothetical protein